MKITERILQVIEYKGITEYKFNKDLGFSNGFLNKSREISTDKYANILAYFSDVNPEWLLTGKGDMLKEKIVNQSIIGDNNQLAGRDINNTLNSAMTTDERIDALIRQNDALSEINAKLAQSVQDAIKMAHETIAANQKQGEANQEIMKRLLSILEEKKYLD